jgi:hypothetical protein
MIYTLTLHGMEFRIGRAKIDNLWEMKGWWVSTGLNTYDGFKTRRAAIAFAQGFFS